MVNCFLLMVSALQGVPPVSLQPGMQLCRRSSTDDGGLSLGPPSRSAAKLGPELTLRPIFFVRFPGPLVPNALLSDWVVCLTLC